MGTRFSFILDDFHPAAGIFADTALLFCKSCYQLSQGFAKLKGTLSFAVPLYRKPHFADNEQMGNIIL
ncbi:MAG: hypothetical protein B0D92_06695 [Spirochaeta sp. LUC14_002_19_P3]|nr:MAG: hypothetical protein B0D92_06695 [Spirochaeta sp. LUC14_002_19_P3]